MPWPDLDERQLHISRVSLTRWLCISVYGSWIILLGLAISLAVWPAWFDVERAMVFRALLPYGLLLYAWWFVGRWVLGAWRRCDRCREPLFGEAGWPSKRMPHHAARKLGGSHVNATAWAYIRHGAARCMWCGHRDGEKPDYVVRG